MKLSISTLCFSLPDAPLEQYILRMDAATQKIKELTSASGTCSDKFKGTFSRIHKSLNQGSDLSSVLKTPIDLRALALIFNTDLASKIVLSADVLQKIETIKPKPGALLLEAIYAHYLKRYDQLHNRQAVESWLIKAKYRRRELTADLKRILGGNGSKWLAEESHRQDRDFDDQVRQVGLDRYRSGRFITVAQNIYYLDVLRDLQVNEVHPVLDEMQKPSVYDSRYDENSLLGHQVLSILIKKSPVSGVNDTWLNVILAIGGDPRVPSNHANHIKWWSQIPPELKNKVQGWLSKLDLRLFLEALENFSYQRGNENLKRMYPARKRFMEGLLNKQLVTGTRLFLSRSAEQYLLGNYESQHLPHYSRVNGECSLIHIQLGGTHIIEGSHNCKLWIYERLDPSAIVFDFSRQQVTYQSLTGGLRDQMLLFGIRHKAEITHDPANFNWQKNALVALQALGVSIVSKDVLTAEDYHLYKRHHGA